MIRAVVSFVRVCLLIFLLLLLLGLLDFISNPLKYVRH